jgi:hypothetical protein
MVLSLLFNFFSSAEPSDFCRGRRFLGMYAFQA